MVLIFKCCFIRLFNKNAFLSTNLDFPIILDEQFASISII
jgi:hypothetical protein